ncbi:helix-turn-helix domain containing protein [Streptomyces sp. T-3]|nr:helix-turn-helix domain containing protein [Streptomyces sp. T-3]
MKEPRNEPLRIELPLAGQPVPERADAARNRRKVLDAAATLLEEQGPACLTMNAVAKASGIGVGTVYRRFGDVATLLIALLDEREQAFQQGFLSGPPPLGPGAPPADRLRAFLHAYADYVDEQRELMLAVEVSDPRAMYGSGPYRVCHTHVAMLVGQLHPEADTALLADLLLAPLRPSLMRHLRTQRGMSVDRIKGGIDALLGLQLGIDAL